MNAAVAGAAAVSTLDSSDQAVEAIRKHFDLNGLSCAEFLIGDAFDILEAKRREGAMYDGIILDPPAFTRNKRTVATALKAYRRLNMLAMEALSTDGILISASCSHHIGKQPFLEMLEASAYRAGRTIRILEYRGASADHPVSVAMPETEYLKLAICSVV